MQVKVNGRFERIADGATVSDLLRILDVNPRQVALEVNRQLVPREQHPTHVLAPDDELEIVTLVGGG